MSLKSAGRRKEGLNRKGGGLILQYKELTSRGAEEKKYQLTAVGPVSIFASESLGVSWGSRMRWKL